MKPGRQLVVCLIVTMMLALPALVRAQDSVWDDDGSEVVDETDAVLGTLPEDQADDSERLGDVEPDPDPYPDKIDSTRYRANPVDDAPPPPPPGVTRPTPRPAEDSPPEPRQPEPGVPRDKPTGKPSEPADSEPSVGAIAADQIGTVGFGGVEQAGDVRGQIRELWQMRRRALAQHEKLKAAEHLSAILALFRRFGGEGPLQSSLREIGGALSREALRAIEEKDTLRALALAENGALLAPDVAPVHLTLARARFAHTPGDMRRVSLALRDGVLAMGRDVDTLLGLALSAVILVLIVALLAPLLAALVLFLRSTKLIVHDLRHLMPRGVSTLQAALLLAVLALLPVLVKLGPLLVTLWWLLLSWGYLRRRERGVMLTLWLLTLLSPLLVLGAARLLGPEAREAAHVYRASRDIGMADARAVLRQALARDDSDAVLHATLAVLLKRDGELPEAKQHLQKAIAQQPDWAWLHNNLGNVLALQGDIDGALAEYGRTVDLEPGLLEGHFNTANLYFRHRKIAQGQSAASGAMTIDPVRFQLLKEMADSATTRLHNRIVVDINVPLAAVLQRLLAAPLDGQRFTHALERALFFGLPSLIMAGVIAVAFVLLLVLGAALERLRPARSCPRCGQAACARCQAELPRHDVCGQCYHAFLAPSKAIDANLKIRKEIEVRRHKVRSDQLRRLLSLVMAGSGHLVAGAAVRGGLALVLFASLVAGILFLGGVVPMPFVVAAGWPVGRLVVLVILFGLLGLWALFSAARLEA